MKAFDSAKHFKRPHCTWSSVLTRGVFMIFLVLGLKKLPYIIPENIVLTSSVQTSGKLGVRKDCLTCFGW